MITAAHQLQLDPAATLFIVVICIGRVPARVRTARRVSVPQQTPVPVVALERAVAIFHGDELLGVLDEDQALDVLDSLGTDVAKPEGIPELMDTLRDFLGLEPAESQQPQPKELT